LSSAAAPVQQRGRPITFIEPSSAVIIAVLPRLRVVAVKCSAAGEGLVRLKGGSTRYEIWATSDATIDNACAMRNTSVGEL